MYIKAPPDATGVDGALARIVDSDTECSTASPWQEGIGYRNATICTRCPYCRKSLVLKERSRCSPWANMVATMLARRATTGTLVSTNTAIARPRHRFVLDLPKIRSAKCQSREAGRFPQWKAHAARCPLTPYFPAARRLAPRPAGPPRWFSTLPPAKRERGCGRRWSGSPTTGGGCEPSLEGRIRVWIQCPQT